jgi:hypothetical protein
MDITTKLLFKINKSRQKRLPGGLGDLEAKSRRRREHLEGLDELGVDILHPRRLKGNNFLFILICLIFFTFVNERGTEARGLGAGAASDTEESFSQLWEQLARPRERRYERILRARWAQRNIFIVHHLSMHSLTSLARFQEMGK